MANKTIYVADADLPLFEQAQALARGNLSAAIAIALRHFVEQARREGTVDVHVDIDVNPTAQGGADAIETDPRKMRPVIVKVGQGGAYAMQRFFGRLLGQQHVRDGHTLLLYRVYQTKKGHLALHIQETPDWANWANWGAWRNWGRGGQQGRDRERGRRRGDPAGRWDVAANIGGVSFGLSDLGQTPGAPTPPTKPAMPSAPDAPNAPPAPDAAGTASDQTTQTAQAGGRNGGAWWEYCGRLEVYTTLDELRPHVPKELFTVVSHTLTHSDNPIEDLDI